MKFSIITVNWNNASGLENTINSVIKQNSALYEFIIIDGGSTDESLNILQYYKEIIDYCVSEKDYGIYDAMNKGANIACGEYLIFMNSGDCFYDETVLEEIIKEDLKDDFIFGSVCYTNKYLKLKIQLPNKLCFYDFLEGLCHQGTFIKRTTFLKLGGYDINLKIVADWAMLIEAIWINHYSYYIYNHMIAYYDISGVSGKQESKKFIINEKNKILNKLNIKYDTFKYKIYRMRLRIIKIRLFYKCSF